MSQRRYRDADEFTVSWSRGINPPATLKASLRDAAQTSGLRCELAISPVPGRTGEAPLTEADTNPIQLGDALPGKRNASYPDLNLELDANYR
jgi:hypothetical protein